MLQKYARLLLSIRMETADFSERDAVAVVTSRCHNNKTRKPILIICFHYFKENCVLAGVIYLQMTPPPPTHTHTHTHTHTTNKQKTKERERERERKEKKKNYQCDSFRKVGSHLLWKEEKKGQPKRNRTAVLLFTSPANNW